jgi:hypothetical protein
MTTSTTHRSLLAVASAVGIATGLGAVPTSGAAYAAPRSHAAPVVAAAVALCDSWTDFRLSDGDVVHLPSAGRNSGNINCTFVSGMSGGGVYKLQDALNRCYGANLVVDGLFGPATEAALRRVELIHHVPPDGIYDPPLRKAMLWPVYNPDGSFDRCAQIGR